MPLEYIKMTSAARQTLVDALTAYQDTLRTATDHQTLLSACQEYQDALRNAVRECFPAEVGLLEELEEL